jgi:hypothetical protein
VFRCSGVQVGGRTASDGLSDPTPPEHPNT